MFQINLMTAFSMDIFSLCAGPEILSLVVNAVYATVH